MWITRKTGVLGIIGGLLLLLLIKYALRIIRLGCSLLLNVIMGHARELITMDVCADNKSSIADGVPEIEEYMKEVLPDPEETEIFKKELLEIVVDVTEFLPNTGG